MGWLVHLFEDRAHPRETLLGELLVNTVDLLRNELASRSINLGDKLCD